MRGAAVIAFLVVIAICPSARCSIFVDKREHPAKGTKTCRLDPMNSAYLQQKGNPYIRSPKIIVERDGGISIGSGQETYPGTKVYFLIDGHRYVGEAGYYTKLDKHAIESLKKDALIQFTFTRWPSRVEISAADIVVGFEAAYDECRSFLGTKS